MTIEFKIGDKGDGVRAIQRKLAAIDDGRDPSLRVFRDSICHGIYDEQTEKAVRDYQSAHRFAPATGICDEQTWRALDKEAGSVFCEAWQFEIDALRDTVPPTDVRPAIEADVIERAHLANLAGLAFSGGGIRSATFNLGILQALAELRMLRDFDYLSTVSGGGYIGAWFSKWLKRLKGDIGLMEDILTPGTMNAEVKKEAEEIRFLRQYSNYLTPRIGFFSADTWSVLTTYIRNTILNLSILVSLLAAVMIIPRLLARFVNDHFQTSASKVFGPHLFPPDTSIFAAAAILAVIWAVFWIAVSISTVPDPTRTKWIRGQSQASIIFGIVLPLLLAAFSGSIALWDAREAIDSAWSLLRARPSFDNPIIIWLYAPGLLYFAVWAGGWMLAQVFNALSARQRAKRNADTPADLRTPPVRFSWQTALKEGFGHLLCAVAALAAGAVLVIVTTTTVADWQTGDNQHLRGAIIHLVAFGMPVLLTVFGITMVLSVGLVGRMYRDTSREWWSRQGAWCAIFVIGWLALVAVSLYAPALTAFVQAKGSGWASALLGSAWLGTTLAGLAVGSSNATGEPDSKLRFEMVAMAAPYFFSVGALFAVSTLVHFMTMGTPVGLIELHPTATLANFFYVFYEQTIEGSYVAMWMTMAALVALGGILAWRIDINEFSLHMMYRNRLVRAYLGASNTRRQPHPFTGFDQRDEVHLDDLFATNGVVQRPYHLVNTTLNLCNGQELAWQTRKAAGFTFAPGFCGFELPSMAAPGGVRVAQESTRGSYRRTSSYRADPRPANDQEAGIRLGTSVAVSGAAASPNMGFHTSPPLAFLMTLFNVRLGRWFINPRRQHTPGASTSPRLGLRYLFQELFGLSDAKANYVYLSDGGHFENLGVYELVRRRCRLIVVVDASADGKLDFDDLGNAIRKCGTDLGIPIHIDVGKIDLLKDAQFSRAHCVQGIIDYAKVDPGAPNGTLLYIKPSLLGTECADVLNYRKTNKAFPHQTTADQWFDETQFESYRALGYRIGMLALERPAAVAQKADGSGHDIDLLCAHIEKLWGDGATLTEGMPAPE
jgi:hypothetical protein